MSKENMQLPEAGTLPLKDPVIFPPLPMGPANAMQRLQAISKASPPQLAAKKTLLAALTQRSSLAQDFHTLIVGYSTGRNDIAALSAFIKTPQKMPSIYTEKSVNGYSHLHDAVHFIPQDNPNTAEAAEKLTAILDVFETKIFPRLHDGGKSLVSSSTKKGVTLLQSSLLSGDLTITTTVFSTVERTLGSTSNDYKKLLKNTDMAGFNLLHQAALSNDDTIFRMVADTINRAFGHDGKAVLRKLANKQSCREHRLPESPTNTLIDSMLTDIRQGTYRSAEEERAAFQHVADNPMVTHIPRPITPEHWSKHLIPSPAVQSFSLPSTQSFVASLDRPTRPPLPHNRPLKPSGTDHIR